MGDWYGRKIHVDTDDGAVHWDVRYDSGCIDISQNGVNTFTLSHDDALDLVDALIDAAAECEIDNGRN